MEEWLCRPVSLSLSEFFCTKDPGELWEREALCIKETLQMKSSVPRTNNLTLSSVPYFLQTSWSWIGGVEIVEWGLSNLESFGRYAVAIRQKGLEIWVDDLSPADWNKWKCYGVDGYKVHIKTAKQFPRFFNEVKRKGKPIVLEHIESKDIEEEAKQIGGNMGQGFLYLPFEMSSKY
ncbi:hypothetical protein LOK74_02020 [Brevibacillus humidisoli]|uniref:hypothetical protein n=1 Tax=Brevibacillus humidisoli TaxID=2895522 RepID=UPI001E42EB52|nr:hypothetical protein [Brevibacillus humidisoli]UFJ41337.1 hypothetical protein LOK74_02020 [Brevibacillus humidisoli]